MLNINQFKKKVNRTRPEWVYKYIFYNNDWKYEIFTMNKGKSFLVSIEEKRLDNKYYPIFKDNVNSIDIAISVLDNFKP
jgi:hypothetical protein